jgi:hypothetical protein
MGHESPIQSPLTSSNNRRFNVCSPPVKRSGIPSHVGCDASVTSNSPDGPDKRSGIPSHVGCVVSNGPDGYDDRDDRDRVR